MKEIDCKLYIKMVYAYSYNASGNTYRYIYLYIYIYFYNISRASFNKEVQPINKKNYDV